MAYKFVANFLKKVVRIFVRTDEEMSVKDTKV